MIDPNKYTKILSEYGDAAKNVVKLGDEEDGYSKKIELEIRFGNYANRKIKYKDRYEDKLYFESGVESHEFFRLLEELDLDEPIEQKDELFELVAPPSPLDRDNTQTVSFRKTTIEDSVEWVIKDKKPNREFMAYPEYKFRVGIAIEKHLLEDLFQERNGETSFYEEKSGSWIPLDKGMVRDKFRYEKILPHSNNILHMTEVNIIIIDETGEKIDTNYEVEIEYSDEYNGPLSEAQLEVLNDDIKYIFKLLYGTYNIYTVNEKTRMIDFVNSVNDRKQGYSEIYGNIMNKARNLKYGDLRIGGIYGNKIGYEIAEKADGQRFLMIINDCGIWLASPKFQYNLVQRINWRDVDAQVRYKVKDLICDGEDIPMSNRKLEFPGVPNSKSWYLPFDLLALKCSSKIQSEDYTNRLQKLSDLKRLESILDKDILTINIKNTLGINSVDDFFIKSSEVLNWSRGYQIDGLIFTPNQEKYNITKDRSKLDLGDRVLTEYSDICKWKGDVTIDLAIGEDSNLKTVIFKEKGKKKEAIYLDFIGTKLVPFIPDNYKRILKTGKREVNLDSLPPGTVVEFKWDGKTFVPIKIRYDKELPNPIQIAEDNWTSISNSIDEATITGKTTKLLRKYHNRIKRNLFDSLPEGSTLLDLASGRGGDASKWHRFSKIIAVEPEDSHINDSLVRGVRKRGLKTRIERSGLSDKVKIVQARGQDTQLITKIVQEFIGGKVDYCAIMLGLSFFWETEEIFNSLVSTIQNNVKKSIIFLTIDGDAIEQLWNPTFAQLKAPPKLEMGNRKDLRVGTDFIQYNPDEKKGPILVNIGDIVNLQYEYLVHLEDLMRFFYIDNIYRADQEEFLNIGEKIMSKLYSYGTFNINLPKMKYKQKTEEIIISSTPTIDIQEKTFPEQVAEFKPEPSGEEEPEDVFDDEPEIEIMEKIEEEPVEIIKIEEEPEIIAEVERVPAEMFETEYDPEDILRKRELLSESGDRLEMLEGKIGAIEQETTQKLSVKWYTQYDVIRISTLADGSCYLHAFLKGFYANYQNNSNRERRIDIVLNLRRDLAMQLDQPDPTYYQFAYDDYFNDLLDQNGKMSEEEAEILTNAAEERGELLEYTYWTTIGDGRNIDILTQQIIDPGIIAQGYDRANLTAMQSDMNSTRCLSDLHIIAISDMIGVDVILFHGYTGNLTFHMTTYLEGREVPRPIVCLIHIVRPLHYELIGVVGSSGIQTVFDVSDPFIQAIFSLIDVKSYIIHHPRDIFIESIIRNYEDYGKIRPDGTIIIPSLLRTTELGRDDPYVSNLYATFPGMYNEQGDIVIFPEQIKKYREFLIDRGFSIKTD